MSATTRNCSCPCLTYGWHSRRGPSTTLRASSTNPWCLAGTWSFYSSDARTANMDTWHYSGLYTQDAAASRPLFCRECSSAEKIKNVVFPLKGWVELWSGLKPACLLRLSRFHSRLPHQVDYLHSPKNKTKTKIDGGPWDRSGACDVWLGS